MVDGNGGSGFADLLTHFWFYVIVGLFLLISFAFHEFAKWLFGSEGNKQEREETIEYEVRVKITHKDKKS